MDQAIQASIVVGAVNLISMLFPGITSPMKIVVAVIVGVALQYTPVDLSPVLAGVELALASSGVYKMVQVVSKR